MKEDKFIWCDVCRTEFADVKYQGSDFCGVCFVEKVSNDSEEAYSFKETHYVLDGEDIGTDDDFINVVKKFAEYFKGEIIGEN